MAYNDSETATTAGMMDPKDMAAMFRTWFMGSFIIICIGLFFKTIVTLGNCIGNKMIVETCWSLGACLTGIPSLVWIILGCIWRFGDEGKIASCHRHECADAWEIDAPY